MTTHVVEIRILGRLMRVNCPEGQQQVLLHAAKEFDKRLQQLSEKTKVTNIEQLVTIAALNLSHEIYTERQKQNENIRQIEWRLAKLEKNISQALLDCSETKDKQYVAASV
ncbi:MAG: cell division protein ZapA [Enterovibrio sp.]